MCFKICALALGLVSATAFAAAAKNEGKQIQIKHNIGPGGAEDLLHITKFPPEMTGVGEPAKSGLSIKCVDEKGRSHEPHEATYEECLSRTKARHGAGARSEAVNRAIPLQVGVTR